MSTIGSIRPGLSDRIRMDQNLSVMIKRLKSGVVERCRERVDRAAEARKGRTGSPEQPPPECGIATNLKKARGL